MAPVSRKKGIVILGSTGSIGRQTLDVVRAFPNRLTVLGLAAHSNLDLLLQQVREFSPSLIAYGGESTEDLLTCGAKRVSMEEMAVQPSADLVVMATVGSAGILSTLEALRAGKRVALANKEVMVMAGGLLMGEAYLHNGEIIPVDSEPSAIWQCIKGERGVDQVILTASGGPFRGRDVRELANVTPVQALHHPTWSMGRKITIDSATLMNKAFEVIEAHWMFMLPWEKIKVLIHPQSIVHSLVVFNDGCVKAQLSPPDMRYPIQYAIFHPARVANQSLVPLDLASIGALTFEELDPSRYPCFPMALQWAMKGGTYPAVLNAADEVAVELFLQGSIGFLDIPRLIEYVLKAHEPVMDPSIDDILETHDWACKLIAQRAALRK